MKTNATYLQSKLIAALTLLMDTIEEVADLDPCYETTEADEVMINVCNGIRWTVNVALDNVSGEALPSTCKIAQRLTRRQRLALTK